MDTLRLRERPLTEADCWYIIRQAQLYRREIGSPLIIWASEPKMVEQFLEWSMTGKLRVYETEEEKIAGILAFDVGYDWWSEERILTELFVFRVDRKIKGFGRLAIRELEQLAEIHQAKIIAAGCFFMRQPQVVMNAYKKAGFTEISPVVTKIRGVSE